MAMDGMRKNLSQFDGMETLRSVHEDKNQTLRVTNGLSSIPPWYSRAELAYNGAGSVTHVDFYGGILHEIREVLCTADLLGSLSGTYFKVYSEYDESTYYVWYNVDNLSVDPSPVSAIGIEVPIQSNDAADVVAFATEQALRPIEDFKVTRTKNRVRIENTRKGTSSSIADFGTGFTLTTVQEGSEQLIKSVDIPYDGKTKYLFNGQERKFEVVPISSATIDVDISAENGDTIAISRHDNPVRLTSETNYLPGALSTSAYTQIYTYTATYDFRIRMLKVKADTFGSFRIKKNATIEDYSQTSQLLRNAEFEFIEDLDVIIGDIITIEFLPDRIQGLANYNFFFRVEGYEPISTIYRTINMEDICL
jgi:hypothetical protein